MMKAHFAISRKKRTAALALCLFVAALLLPAAARADGADKNDIASSPPDFSPFCLFVPGFLPISLVFFPCLTSPGPGDILHASNIYRFKTAKKRRVIRPTPHQRVPGAEKGQAEGG
jgi:hypothetical protein